MKRPPTSSLNFKLKGYVLYETKMSSYVSPSIPSSLSVMVIVSLKAASMNGLPSCASHWDNNNSPSD